MEKISPSQPHFFWPILPRFIEDLKNQTSFSSYSDTGDGYSSEAVLIRRARGKEWRVEIKDGVIRCGWNTFARGNNMKHKNFVICQLIRKMVFQVHVLDDATQCEYHETDAELQWPLDLLIHSMN